jgi:hypothetical protein
MLILALAPSENDLKEVKKHLVGILPTISRLNSVSQTNQFCL